MFGKLRTSILLGFVEAKEGLLRGETWTFHSTVALVHGLGCRVRLRRRAGLESLLSSEVTLPSHWQ